MMMRTSEYIYCKYDRNDNDDDGENHIYCCCC